MHHRPHVPPTHILILNVLPENVLAFWQPGVPVFFCSENGVLGMVCPGIVMKIVMRRVFSLHVTNTRYDVVPRGVSPTGHWAPLPSPPSPSYHSPSYPIAFPISYPIPIFLRPAAVPCWLTHDARCTIRTIAILILILILNFTPDVIAQSSNRAIVYRPRGDTPCNILIGIPAQPPIPDPNPSPTTSAPTTNRNVSNTPPFSV